MTQHKYFREELAYLREQGKVFSKTFPQLSRFLQSRSHDPDIERLLEGFAFLTAQLRCKVDDEFPELTHSIINMLWPNYLRPLPSMAIVAFEPDPGLTQVQTIEKGTMLDSYPVEETHCHFSTCRDLLLLPIACTRVDTEHTRETTKIILTLNTINETLFSTLEMTELSIYLGAQAYCAQMLYFWLNHHLKKTSVLINGREYFLPTTCIQTVGFDKKDALLPYPKNISDSYRLLQEYLTFPEAFHFFKINALAAVLFHAKCTKIDICLYFDKTIPADVVISAQQFRLHCVPVINLFEHDADPIDMAGKKSEYLIVSSSRAPSHYEVFSVDKVVGWLDKTNKTRGAKRVYSSFESFQHEIERARDRKVLYYRSRIKNSLRGDGFDTFISFVRADESQCIDLNETVSIKLTCTNRYLPTLLGIGDICIPTESSPVFAKFHNITAPTQPLHPMLDGSLLWMLISNMSLNYLSLLSSDALKTILNAYDFKALVDKQSERMSKMRLSSLVNLTSTPIDRLVNGYPVRGLQSFLTLDQSGFGSEGDLYLFGTVLSHFFSLYANINSFHELIVINKTNNEEYKWKMQTGTQPLI